jgi:hypothetical protein
LSGEEGALPSTEPNLPAAVIVLDALRPLLTALVGVNGFSVLLARALALAKSQAIALNAAEVRPDGTLNGMTEIDVNDVQEAGVVLVAQLLGLLVAFIGEKLTLQILSDVWPTFDSSHSALPGEEDK